MSRKDNNSGIKHTLSHAYWLAGASLGCHWCAKGLPLSKLTVDHVIPRWSGGRHSPSNAVLACGDCNTDRDGWHRFYAGFNASPPGTLASVGIFRRRISANKFAKVSLCRRQSRRSNQARAIPCDPSPRLGGAVGSTPRPSTGSAGVISPAQVWAANLALEPGG